MKYLLSFIFLNISILGGYAQNGILMGSVTDSLTQKPIAYVTIAVLFIEKGRPDSVVAGGLTNEKGKFVIPEIRSGKYDVQLNYMGYSEKNLTKVVISSRTPVKDLGDIYLAFASISLDEVEIIGETQFLEIAIDRKVYNVDKMLTTMGGDATDVLQNIPSVAVDIDGNVSLRGSQNVNILIDGRPSTMTGGSRQAILDQIPSKFD